MTTFDLLRVLPLPDVVTKEEESLFLPECPCCSDKRKLTKPSSDYIYSAVCRGCSNFPLFLAYPASAMLSNHSSQLEKKYKKERPTSDSESINADHIIPLLDRIESLNKPGQSYQKRKEALRTRGLKLLVKLYGWLLHYHRQKGSRATYINRLPMLHNAVFAAIYDLRHPELTRFDPKWLAKDVGELCAEGPLSWSMNLLTPEYCDLLVDEIESYCASNPLAKMNYYEVRLDELGFKKFFKKLTNHLNELVAHKKSRTVTLRYATASAICNSGRRSPLSRGELELRPLPAIVLGQGAPASKRPDLIINHRLQDTEIQGNLTTPEFWDDKKAQYRSLSQEQLHAPPTPAKPERYVQPICTTLSVPPYIIPGEPGGYRKYSITPEPYRAVIYPAELKYLEYPPLSNSPKGERIHLLLGLRASYRFEYFMQLDREIQNIILGFCTPTDVLSFSQCSHAAHELVKELPYWRNAFHEIFGQWNPECRRYVTKGVNLFASCSVSDVKKKELVGEEEKEEEKEDDDEDWRERFQAGPLSYHLTDPAEPEYGYTSLGGGFGRYYPSFRSHREYPWNAKLENKKLTGRCYVQ